MAGRKRASCGGELLAELVELPRQHEVGVDDLLLGGDDFVAADEDVGLLSKRDCMSDSLLAAEVFGIGREVLRGCWA